MGDQVGDGKAAAADPLDHRGNHAVVGPGEALPDGGADAAVVGAQDAEAAAVDEELERLDEALDVHHALTRLGGDCREILDRFFARDESYKTIGAALDLPSGTIASRISRCLIKLKDTLEGRKPRLAPSGGSVTR